MCTDILATILLDTQQMQVTMECCSVEMAPQGMRPQRVALPVRYSSKGARKLGFSK